MNTLSVLKITKYTHYSFITFIKYDVQNRSSLDCEFYIYDEEKDREHLVTCVENCS